MEKRIQKKDWKCSNCRIVLHLGITLNRDWKSYDLEIEKAIETLIGQRISGLLEIQKKTGPLLDPD